MKLITLITPIVLSLILASGCAAHAKKSDQDNSSKNEQSTPQQEDAQLTDGRWKLITLLGQEVTTGEGEKAAYLNFNKEEQRVSGFNSCNNISGGYSVETGQRLRFTQMISTMRACMNSIEPDFMKVLERADNFTISGDTLSLNKARMAPLARFVLEDEKE